MIRRPPRSTLSSSSAASDVYKRQVSTQSTGKFQCGAMIRVISERLVRPHHTRKVQQIMAGVESSVQRVPGLLEIETLNDESDHHKYIILTRWRTKQEYEAWLKDPSYRETQKQLDILLEGPAKYRVLNVPQEDMFLL
eukprot:TRINITY_DN1307_c0_g1_i3.p1 TRINITY_DN1307_c0_g1~~TRINITY_DN1307_c0_g1_i3.p1  ORF type:complete len:138 (+),score=47.32 TRINITY_DN1307_c0_g1_i3:133-546(+)